MNPLYSLLGNNMPGQFGNMMKTIQEFQKFKSTFQGDPKQQVQELLNSGKMTQEQFDQLQSMATQLQKIMSGR